jgi:hypothetical protein
VLTKALASERQRVRVEAAILEIHDILTRHESQLAVLSDPQYKLLNESILALLHSTEVEKYRYLCRAVENCLREDELVPQEAAVLSRILRDMSATEAGFIVQNFGFQRVWLNTTVNEDGGQSPTVHPSSPEAIVVSGLISLGLLLSSSSEYAGLGMFSWSPITAKLLALLRDTAA